MRRLFCISMAALVGSLLALPGYAEDSSEKPAPVQRYQLKNRSSFRASETSRDPFWPIGHIKRDRNTQVPVAPVPVAKLSPEMFSVTSILLGNPSLAIINGRSYGEGEYLRTSRPSATKGAAPNNAIVVDPSLRVRVVRIVDGLVSLRSTDGQSLDVPMRRSELNEKKADAEEEQLLSNQ